MADEIQGSEMPSKRLTPVEVQQQVFRRAMFRGYNEQDVDDFLDDVTEELSRLLEDQRLLREQLQSGATAPLLGGGDLADAKRMADDIVREAREEAAEIIRNARTAAAAAAGGGGSALQPFLAQERGFLQDLSRIIQDHADTVRDMARARRRPAPSGPDAARAPEPAVPEAAAADASEPEVTSVPEASPPEGSAAGSGSVKELFYGED
jgi:cell division initiation protein